MCMTGEHGAPVNLLQKQAAERKANLYRRFALQRPETLIDPHLLLQAGLLASGPDPIARRRHRFAQAGPALPAFREAGAARRMNVTTERKLMTRRINRAIELLAQGQAIYYVGGHTGHRLTHDRGGRTRTSGLTTSMSGWSTARSTWRGSPNTWAAWLRAARPVRATTRWPSLSKPRSTAPTRPMCASAPGSSAKSSAAAFAESCCVKRNRRVRFARLSNRADIRIIRPGWVRTCPRRSSECTAPPVKRPLAGSASVPAAADRK